MPFDGIVARVRSLCRLRSRTRTHIEAEVSAELRTFLAERVDQFMARGMSEADARAEALRRLGSPPDKTIASLHKSAMTRDRRLRVRATFDDVGGDLRYTVRALRRSAGFTAFAVVIIALGIGASTTVFSVANALLVRPLPFSDPGSLVWIPNSGDEGLSARSTQSGSFVDLAKQNQSFSGLEAYSAFYGVGDTTLGGGTDVVRVSTVEVSQAFFPLLGVRPLLGRSFTADECSGSGPRAVLVSYSLWERRFESDRNIVGTPVTMNGTSVTVVGVLPASFDFGSVFAPGAPIDLFTPFPMTERANRYGNTLAVIGRLKPGVTLAYAAAELIVLGRAITAAHPERNEFGPRASSLRAHVSGSAQSALVVLACAVAVVMLIVCANVSNLLLARATTRQKAMAIRVALGAGRGRLVRQMLTESVVLSSGGAALGLLLAVVGTYVIAHSDAVTLPLIADVRVDARALGFTALLAVVTGLTFGLAPALQVPDSAVPDALKASGRSATDAGRGQWVRRPLVVSEIALACVLLVASGLLIRSFLKVLDVNLGFRPEMVASIRVDPDRQYLTSQSRFIAYVDDVMRLARQVPGIQSVAIADGLPLAGNRAWGVSAKGHAYAKGQGIGAYVLMASDGYLDTLGMHLVAGRDFSPRDSTPGDPVIIVNETAARVLWPGENAIGQLMVADRERRVVGVVGDVRHLALEQGAGLEMYIPVRQTGDFAVIDLVVRTTLPPQSFATAIREALAPVAANLPTNEFQTLRGIVDQNVSPRRFFTSMLGAFALFALGVALVGIYSVISYTVNHRTQEIGLCMALGASPGLIQGRILRETLELAAVGVLLGTLGSWLLAHTLESFLFGVTASDPVTFVGMWTAVTAVATVSGYLPARRASRIDPVVALRSS